MSAEKETTKRRSLSRDETAKEAFFDLLMDASHRPKTHLRKYRALIKKTSQNRRQAIIDGVITAYAAALLYLEIDYLWLNFIKAKEWAEFKGERPSKDNREMALKFTLRFLNGMTGTSATKRASKHYRALQPLFAERKNPYQALHAIRAAGGLEKLAKLNAVPTGAKPVKKPMSSCG